MENGHGGTISNIFLHCNGPLLNPPSAQLFVSDARMTYGIFVETAELIKAVYFKMAAVYLSIGSGNGCGGRRQ